MKLRKFKPLSPEIYLNKYVGDSSLARLGHVNGLAQDVQENKADQELRNMDYPFIWYPESTLFDAGPTYHYFGVSGSPLREVTLNSYKVRGIVEYSGSSVISIYLGTIKIIPGTSVSGTVVFPGKLTGMVMATDGGDTWDPTVDLTTTPLASGALMWDVDANTFSELQGVKVIMYSYGPADPITGEVNYALVLEGYTAVPTVDLAEALISYEFEFVTTGPQDDTRVTLWWD